MNNRLTMKATRCSSFIAIGRGQTVLFRCSLVEAIFSWSNQNNDLVSTTKWTLTKICWVFRRDRERNWWRKATNAVKSPMIHYLFWRKMLGTDSLLSEGDRRWIAVAFHEHLIEYHVSSNKPSIELGHIPRRELSKRLERCLFYHVAEFDCCWCRHVNGPERPEEMRSQREVVRFFHQLLQEFISIDLEWRCAILMSSRLLLSSYHRIDISREESGLLVLVWIEIEIDFEERPFFRWFVIEHEFTEMITNIEPSKEQRRTSSIALASPLLPVIVRTVFEVDHGECLGLRVQAKDISRLEIVVGKAHRTIDRR